MTADKYGGVFLQDNCSVIRGGAGVFYQRTSYTFPCAYSASTLARPATGGRFAVSVDGVEERHADIEEWRRQDGSSVRRTASRE
jgi:hypothetical protein